MQNAGYLPITMLSGMRTTIVLIPIKAATFRYFQSFGTNNIKIEIETHKDSRIKVNYHNDSNDDLKRS